jgi:acyl dehydratase
VPAVPLDQSFIGRSYELPPYEVGREKIREFAEAIGESSQLSRNQGAARAAGYSDIIAPPTFAIVMSLKANDVLINDPKLGLDYRRVVHGDQAFTQHRPIVAGDQLSVTLHVDDITCRMGNDLLSLRAEIVTTTGEPVTTTRSTLVVRGEQA